VFEHKILQLCVDFRWWLSICL